MSDAKKTALLFPGQGSQEKGMGRAIAEADAEAMELWVKAEKISGAELRAVYWEGEEADMAQTRWLQPALTVVNLSVFLGLAGRVAPLCAAGHSLGEFAALAASRALSIDAVLTLVSLRGRLMSEAGDGTGAMAALLKVDQSGAEELVAAARESTGKELRIANYNTPAQFVISGHRDAVEAASALAKERKARAVPLAVSGAFHSPLMAEAAAEFEKALAKIDVRDAAFPLVMNATGAPVQAAAEIRACVARQMTSSVFWTQGVRAMWELGARSFVECGPKGVLTRMLSPILDPIVTAVAGETPYTSGFCADPEQIETRIAEISDGGEA
ncbi:Acyl transferase [Desulfovibrio sp. X2]|uniref:ACP S-malonyltransferase n=1 Tax=Desulfovibrio sp. X2 TaxID=941449 RepID=UPI000358B366|nr:ACP S-malonyltransferase [Desulfovibrio sp. X2]EPR37518.1 Acyl transferase [Desulfovibrio sp. X2]